MKILEQGSLLSTLFPGQMWIGYTVGWLGDFPNPAEVDGAIKDCYLKAG